ncbi:Choline-sulfatase [Poriferisphaera corsica]|uniref:Choline-sulfatase n=2 Tax=Poriferisphaera corsica TaxID=2528020 RepID=A0A517YRI8_9BACT|nr:Choline-sulfatase [Poriferisphaera corsica]
MVTTASSPADPLAFDSLITGLHARQMSGHLVATDEDLVDEEGEKNVRPYSQRQLDVSLAGYLRDAGYHTAGVGLVRPFLTHLDQSVCLEDLDIVRQSRATEDLYYRHLRKRGLLAAIMKQRMTRKRYGPFKPERLLLEPCDDIDGFIARQAEEMIPTLPEDRPWALFIVMAGPDSHLPPPTIYDGLVSTKHLRDGFTLADFRGMHAMTQPVFVRTSLQHLDPGQLARIRADYLGRVSMVDYAVRQIVTASDQRKDRERTWTVFTSDRGTMLGEKGLVGHQSFHSGCIQTPLIVAPPRHTTMPHDAIPEGFFSTADVVPTLLDIAGVKQLSNVRLGGRSLKPLLMTDDLVPKDTPLGLISEFEDRLLIETQRYKIVYRTPSFEPMAVYDLIGDIDEKKNLVNSTIGFGVANATKPRLDTILQRISA